MTFFCKFLLFHGAFYSFTGLWPIVDIRSFERVTGPKQDKWLVKTVGSLITVSGLVLLSAAARQGRAGRPFAANREVILLAAGNALAIGSVSLVYSAKGIISKIYLLDTVVEYLLACTYLALGLEAQAKKRVDYEVDSEVSEPRRQKALEPNPEIA